MAGTHALITASHGGVVGTAAEVSYCGPGTPRKIVDGAASGAEKYPIVGQRWYLTSRAISNAYTEVLNDVGVWGMGKSEKFSVVLRNVIVQVSQAEGGGEHASDGGAKAVLRLAIPVDPILPRCPRYVEEEPLAIVN
jgi:hypothetical protein